MVHLHHFICNPFVSFLCEISYRCQLIWNRISTPRIPAQTRTRVLQTNWSPQNLVASSLDPQLHVWMEMQWIKMWLGLRCNTPHDMTWLVVGVWRHTPHGVISTLTRKPKWKPEISITCQVEGLLYSTFSHMFVFFMQLDVFFFFLFFSLYHLR
jgi:hypothetical protein